MNNRAFSKIWIIIIIVLVAGGILAWHYQDWIYYYYHNDVYIPTLQFLNKPIPPKVVPPNWPVSKSCTKNEDCGIDTCQQGRDKCVEVKYICENGKCVFPAKTQEFPSPPYKCWEGKCREEEEVEEKITVLSPIKGEKWEIGKTYQIRWAPNDSEGIVVIRLYNNAAPTSALRLVWEASEPLPNIGTYSFTVFEGLEPGDRYQFFIIAYVGKLEGYKGYSAEFSIAPEVIEDETADWKTYEWGRLEFKYPPTWVVEDIYYSTPAQQFQGEPPTNIGVELFPGEKINEKDFIAIGGRQISCDPAEHHTKCYYISSVANFTYTDSNNPEILRVFDLFIKTIMERETDKTTDWKTYRNEEYGFEFKYPKEKFETAYGKWPPMVRIIPANEDFKKICPDLYWEIAKKQEVIINEIRYFTYIAIDSAAGSTYEDHCYITLKGDKYFGLEFIASYPTHCGMFTEGEEGWIKCMGFDRTKDVEEPIEQIVSTFRFLK